MVALLVCAVALAGVAAAAGAGAAAAGAGSAAAGGVGVGAGAVAFGVGAEFGAAVGEAGVPKPGGVQAQARAAPVTPTLNTDNTARQTTRTLFCTRFPPRSTS
jgi:hypothetical protein